MLAMEPTTINEPVLRQLVQAAAVVGAPLGNLALTRVSPEPMRWAISAIVLTAVGLLASGWRFHGQWRPPVTLGIGAISGFLNGLSGMAGPPIAFYYLAGNETVERVRANLTTYFIFVDAIALLVFAGRLPGWSGTRIVSSRHIAFYHHKGCIWRSKMKY